MSAAMLPGAATPVERILSRFERRDVEGFISVAIGLLDALDGDAEAEDGDEDCCAAGDDRIEGESVAFTGMCEDDEDDDPGGGNVEDERQDPLTEDGH